MSHRNPKSKTTTKLTNCLRRCGNSSRLSVGSVMVSPPHEMGIHGVRRGLVVVPSRAVGCRLHRRPDVVRALEHRVHHRRVFTPVHRLAMRNTHAHRSRRPTDPCPRRHLVLYVIKQTDATTVSSTTYLIPVLAVAAGVAFLGEPLTWYVLVGWSCPPRGRDGTGNGEHTATARTHRQ